MTHFQGFATKEEESQNKDDYRLAVTCGGLNKEKFPYCVQWNETQM